MKRLLKENYITIDLIAKIFWGYVLFSYFSQLIFNDPTGLVLNILLISFVPASTIQIDILSGNFRTRFTSPKTRFNYVKSKFLLAIVCNCISIFLITGFLIANHLKTGLYDWSYYNQILLSIPLSCLSIFLCLVITPTVYVTTMLNLIVIIPTFIGVIFGGVETYLTLIGKIFLVCNSKLCLLAICFIYFAFCYSIYKIAVFFFEKKELTSFK